jgi:ATP-dependent Zn protease
MWAVVITMFLVMMTMTQNSMNNKPANELGFSDMIAAAQSGDIQRANVDVSTGLVTGERADGTPFQTNSSPYAAGETQAILMESGVNLDYEPVKQPSAVANLLFSLLPLVLYRYRDFLHALYAGRGSRRRYELW